jgi:hypothetical protein
LDAREVDAWQAAVAASLGDAGLRRQRSVKVSMRGRSMIFGP